MSADAILLGRTFTADASAPWANGVAVRDGVIIAVGSRDAVMRHCGTDTMVWEADGLTCPAFNDAHIHLLEGALFDLWVNLHDAAAPQYLSVIAAAASQRGPRDWVRGGGWTMAAFPGGSPPRHDLDAVVGDRPAYLTARDGHTAWVSTAALRLAGIDRDTPNPPGGRIERDAHGEPAGALHETAMKLVAAHLPDITADEWASALEVGQRYLHSLGIVSWQDARLSTPMLRAYLDAESGGRLHSRVAVALHWDPARGPEQIDALIAARAEACGELVAAPMVKIFADGVVENRTAAVHRPYRCSDSRGEPLFDRAGLAAAVATCVEAGFSVHVHAVGDAATTDTLDAFEAVREISTRRGLRHQICHLQVVSPSDTARFAELGVLANVQALWACRDEQNLALCAPALGSERFEGQYPFGDLARAGARLAFGSDWRVSTPDPLAQIEVAVTRQPPGDPDTEPLGPDQALDLTTCLLGFTREAAFAAAMDHRTGSLTVGRDADIVVLDADPYRAESHRIGSIRPDLTLFRGEVVYSRS